MRKAHKRGKKNRRSKHSPWQGDFAEFAPIARYRTLMSYSHYDLHQQAQPVNTYGAGQNRERKQLISTRTGMLIMTLAPESTYTPEYIGSQGQIHSASFQDQTYQSVKPPDNAAASFGPNVPGYHAQSSPLAAHAGPWNTGHCRYPNCHHPAARDEGTQELTEYCSLEHMRFVVAVQALVVLALNIAFGHPGMIYGAVFPHAQPVIGVLAASAAITADPPANGGTHNGNNSHSISDTIHHRG